MPPDDAGTIEGLFSTLGIPLGLLILVLFFLWRVARACKPWGEKVVNAHVRFVEESRTQLAAQGEALVGLSEDHVVQNEKLDGMCERCSTFATATSEKVAETAKLVSATSDSVANLCAGIREDRQHRDAGG